MEKVLPVLYFMSDLIPKRPKKRVFIGIFVPLDMMEQMAKKFIISVIDFFYPPFSRVMPLQTFRYAACGGTNTLLDIFMYAVAYNFILHKQDLNLGFIVFKPHIASII